jgi:hypothetical protein
MAPLGPLPGTSFAARRFTPYASEVVHFPLVSFVTIIWIILFFIIWIFSIRQNQNFSKKVQ